MTTLLALLFQSTILLTLGLLAVRLARRRGPAVQTLVGRATLSGVALLLLLAPVSGRIAPVWRIPTPVRPSPTLPQREGEEVRTGGAGAPDIPLKTAPAGVTVTEPGAASDAPAMPAPPSSYPKTPHLPAAGGSQIRSNAEGIGTSGVGACAGAGTLVLLLWLTLCQIHLIRLRRAAQIITAGPAIDLLAALTPNPPPLLTHPAVHSPFLAGLHRPAIFLPADYETAFPPDALRAIFVHELAHRDRRDNAWPLAARLLCAVLWFQPLLWLLVRQMEHISEDACDEAVLAAYCPPRAYAACLLTLAEHPIEYRQRALGAGVAPFRSSVGRRISRILSTKGVPAMPAITLRLRLTIAALSLTAALSSVFLISSAPAQVRAQVTTAAPIPKMPLIVGTWFYQNQPISSGSSGLIVYQPDGKFAYLFPGTARREASESFGTYVIDGSKLKEFTTRASFDDPNNIGRSNVLPINVTYTAMQFSISGNTLTIRDGSGEVSVAKRLSPAEATVERQKLLGTTHFESEVLQADTSPSSQTIRTEVLRQTETDLSEAQKGKTALTTDSNTLGQAQFLAGLTPVQGPGVVVTLTNSKKSLSKGLPADMTPPNLIHDTDINQVLNEMKAAGAEAIAVNGQRLVATSAVRTAGRQIFVNDAPQAPPYTIQAIGSSTALLSVLNAPGGIASQLRSFDKAMFSVQQAATLTLPAYVGKGQMRFVRPVIVDNALHHPE